MIKTQQQIEWEDSEACLEAERAHLSRVWATEDARAMREEDLVRGWGSAVDTIPRVEATDTSTEIQALSNLQTSQDRAVMFQRGKVPIADKNVHMEIGGETGDVRAGLIDDILRDFKQSSPLAVGHALPIPMGKVSHIHLDGSVEIDMSAPAPLELQRYQQRWYNLINVEGLFSRPKHTPEEIEETSHAAHHRRVCAERHQAFLERIGALGSIGNTLIKHWARLVGLPEDASVEQVVLAMGGARQQELLSEKAHGEGSEHGEN